ncbi:MAG: SOS response-associated peptidase [Saprospiraceae bacterium]|nr:SOS response-associated peptidase [Bacteroidia bacterium]NNE14862.1 SOS response-associated peptidase [Saprospiraceae bacterium]NNL91904.1 SOS response-associated peptidase [Saprospiraceae bacterium]
MCGRSSLTKTEKELEERFNATFYSEDLERYNPIPNFNVAPSHMMPIITQSDKTHFQAMRWGFIPFWAKDVKIGYKMINARVETVLEKNTFKKAVSNKRCLVPADGFYEWKRQGKIKQPFRIQKKDGSLFSYAGLWSKWISPQGETIYSFTVITQPPNKLVEDIHDRMPAILTEEQEELWLSEDLSPEDLVGMIAPYPDELLIAYPVSDKVNNVRNNDKSLLERKNDEPLTLF